MLNKSFYSTFPGLNTASNVLNLAEGSLTKALNVTIVKENVIEPRHGIPPWSIGRVLGSTTLWPELLVRAPRVIYSTDLAPGVVNLTNLNVRVGDVLSLHLLTGTLPGSYTEGNPITVYSVPDANSALVTGYGSIPAGVNTYELRYNYKNERFQNIFHWKVDSTSRYVTTSRTTDNTFTTYLIKPNNYLDLTSLTEYVASGTRTYSSVGSAVFKYPRYITSNKGLYISELGGWVVVREPTFPGLVVETLKQPFVVITSGVTKNDTANNWLRPGNAIRIKAVASKILAEGSELESAPSQYFEVKNTTGIPQIVHIEVSSTSPTETINIYRTKQYALATTTVVNGVAVYTETSPEVDYYLTASTSTSSTGSFGDRLFSLDLIFNDDLIIGQGQLYTNINEEGDDNANQIPPICNDAYSFKGHTFFADILGRPTAPMTLLSLQATSSPVTAALDGKNIIINGNTVTFRNFSYVTTNNPLEAIVEINPDGFLGNGYGLFIGSGVTSSGQYYAPGASTLANRVKLTTYAYDAATGKGDAVPDGQLPQLPVTNSYDGTTGELKVQIDVANFNFAKFDVVGGGYVFTKIDVRTDNLYSMLFKYTSIVRDPATANQVIFKGARQVDAYFGYPGDLCPPVTPISQVVNMYYIAGASINTLPLYLGSGSQNDPYFGSGDITRFKYLSLVPSKKRPQSPIAVLKQSIETSFAGTATGVPLMATWEVDAIPVGATDRSNTQLIDDTVANLVRAYNNVYSYSGDILIKNQLEAGSFTITDLRLEPVTVRVSDATIGAKFSPVLTTSDVTLIDSSKTRVKNGICISKQGNPEQVPLSMILAPEPVGNSQNRIMKMASLKDTMFFFKENEGVYSCSIQAGTAKFPSAILNEVVPFDLTIKPIAAESIRIIDDQIIYLSDKGFVRIQNGRHQVISDAIDVDVKINSSRSPDMDKVVAYIDPVKRLYVCHIPMTNINGTGITYVFNLKSELWSTSDVQFDWGVSDNIGRVSTISTDYRLAADPVAQYAVDGASTASGRPVLSQYFRQEQLTGRITDGVVTVIYDPVVSGSGDQVSILQQAVNVLNSSFDQFDERVIGFTSATLNGLSTITVTRSAAQFGASQDYDLRFFCQRLMSKQLYFKTTFNGVPFTNVPVTPVSAVVSNTLVTFTFALPTYTTSVTLDESDDMLMVGVNTDLEFAPYHLGSPQTLKQFSEAQIHYQDRVEPNSLPLILEASFAVDNQSAFSAKTRLTRALTYSGVYRFLIPIEATRGRYLRIRLQHNTPENYYQIVGLMVCTKLTPSTNTVSKS